MTGKFGESWLVSWQEKIEFCQNLKLTVAKIPSSN
jgi:hypothetical protein